MPAIQDRRAHPSVETSPGGVFVVVPAYNEERTITEVIRALRRHGIQNVLVVDDGSTDATASLALREGAAVLRHILNRGLGGALGTGIHAALRRGAQVIVTFDADGQHAPEDAWRAIAPIVNGETDVVIGSRLLVPGGMPWHRRLANRVGNLVTLLLFNARVTDSQSGLRALSRKAAELIEIRCDGMEVSSEIIADLFRRKFRVLEIPIASIYSEYSLSKGQGFLMGLRTLGKLLLLRAGGGRG